jgi:hypothetical protein
VERQREKNVWFHTKLTMAPLFEAPQKRFAVFLAGFEVRETLYMLRGSYGSVLSEKGGHGAEILLFFARRTAGVDARLFLRVQLDRSRPRRVEIRGRSSLECAARTGRGPDGQSLREILFFIEGLQ